MRTTPLRLFLLTFMLLFSFGMVSSFPFKDRVLAQDDPTDVPFPTSAATATSVTSAEATLETTAEITAEATSPLTLDDAIATSAAAQSSADQLRAENKTLQDSLASAQSDKGATLYALVIVVLGLMLAFAVFFGLRRSSS